MSSILKTGITMLIHNKDGIEFVTEFPCLLGHPVYMWQTEIYKLKQKMYF